MGNGHFKGHPDRGNDGGDGGRPTGEVGLGFAPVLTFGRWTNALDIGIGYNFGSTVGKVTDGGSISLRGFLSAISLSTGVLF